LPEDPEKMQKEEPELGQEPELVQEEVESSVAEKSFVKNLKNFLTHKITQYVGFALWSILIMTAGGYYLIQRNNQNILSKMHHNHAAADSLAYVDSTFADTAKVDTAYARVDSMEQQDRADLLRARKTQIEEDEKLWKELEKDTTFLAELKEASQLISADNVLGAEDQIRVLAVENGRRRREVDHLWEESLAQKKLFNELVSWTKKAIEDQNDKFLADGSGGNLNEPGSDSTQKSQSDENAVTDDSEIKARAIATSAKIYSSMDPKQAARIISDLDIEVAAKILLRIRQRQAAKILEAMNIKQATEIGRIMASGVMN
jgi:flagellar motility protein MotE (MotC chaperone)